MELIREFQVRDWEKMKCGERRMGWPVAFLYGTLPDEIISLHPCNMRKRSYKIKEIGKKFSEV